MPTLNWIGKDAVVTHHQDVPFRLLEPVQSLSCGDAESGNLIVQGDNLLALKALLPRYAGQVKCIYIDPPYNTGNEGWAYNDNVNSAEIRKWLGEVVGKEGETLDRHDRWLCMMYPRLVLLRQFLREDGAIFVSIDDNEVALLRLLMDEIFGRQNFIAEMIWEGAFKNDARQIGVNHEYVMLYARTRISLPREWNVAKDGAEAVLKEVTRLQKLHGDNYEAASDDLAGWFRASKATESFAHRRFRYIDKHGAYKEDDPTAPGGRRFELVNPLTGKGIPLRANRGWAFDQKTFDDLVADGRISFVTDTTIMVRRYFHETDVVTPQSVFYQPTRSASERLGKLLGTNAFEFPKDETILQKFIEMATDKDSLILDSFAGSGTTAHAVLKQNAEDGGNRRFILVEMDAGIARDVTAERVKRVARGYAKGALTPTLSQEEREKNWVAGLGGGFQFCTLGQALFDARGHIDPGVRFAELARFVWFMETGMGLPAARASQRRADTASPLLGVHEGRAVYLLYNGILKDRSIDGGNVLTTPLLQQLPAHDGPRVIYAARSAIGTARLRQLGISFRQLPYDLRVAP
ncbi:MAG: site-specific DNA-methyltransferase [Metallibacterium sp.]